MSKLHFSAKCNQYVIITDRDWDDWDDWSLSRGCKLEILNWETNKHKQYEYDLMLELTRLGVDGVTPAAKLIAIEMMKGNNNDFNK